MKLSVVKLIERLNFNIQNMLMINNFRINFLNKLFHEHYQSVKRSSSR